MVMDTLHPLDRPVWYALTTRQATLAEGDDRAWRFAARYGVFAAAADDSPEAMSALVALTPLEGAIALVETQPIAPPPGLRLVRQPLIDQMIAPDFPAEAPDDDVVALGDDDAAEMLALATLTEPGPFFSHTHRLGDFIGIKRDGKLAAMAGERMKLPGLTEVSAVCTHPNHRGHGYAARLFRLAAARIAARGETPFLHVYPDNAGAIRLYEAMGFRRRRQLVLSVFARA
jgi:predicted GNAT family acetyltransferase